MTNLADEFDEVWDNLQEEMRSSAGLDGEKWSTWLESEDD